MIAPGQPNATHTLRPLAADQVLLCSALGHYALLAAALLALSAGPAAVRRVCRDARTAPHLKCAYAAAVLNGMAYALTLLALRPTFLLPTRFVLFRGWLRNRFGMVSVTVCWANVCAGILATTLQRLLRHVPLSNTQRALIGTLPYVLLHLTEVVPQFVYVLLTTEYVQTDRQEMFAMEGQHWITEDMGLYYFPFTELNKVFWAVQLGSFALGAAGFAALAAFGRCGGRPKRADADHALAVLLLFLLPWSLVFGAILFRLPDGMALVQAALGWALLYPTAEICCFYRFMGGAPGCRPRKTRVYAAEIARKSESG